MTLDAFMSWQEIRLRRQLGTALPRGGAFQPPRVVADPMPLPRTTKDRRASDATAAILRDLGKQRTPKPRPICPRCQRVEIDYRAAMCRPCLKALRNNHAIAAARVVVKNHTRGISRGAYTRKDS
ncbi:MAG TPA: hypothetical protein VEA16_09240 [Vicinamibacterales bacterium]|nr:hypothetical protein [Vicinamibacterales bacterium]